MSLALGHPDHGYYMTRDPFGASGDFTTAPEISQMFGELIAAWCVDTWDRLGQPEPFALVELGPGRGTLIADILRVAKLRPGFSGALRVHLVETSPVLQQRQQQLLASFKVDWHEHVATVPDGPALFLMNEFLDALPVRQFVMTNAGLAERHVSVDEVTGGLCFVTDSAALVPSGLAATEDLPIGMVLERSPTGMAMIERIAGRIAQAGGAALIIDYGYEENGGATLQALRHQAQADPLEHPGEADLTAHVDFTAVARSAGEMGCSVYGRWGRGSSCGASASPSALRG